MDDRRYMMKPARLLVALLFILCLTALPGFGASDPSRFAFDNGLFPNTIPLFSDFDGDNKVDHAELFSNGVQKRIHVTFGTLAWKSLSFDSGLLDRGRLVSDDIDLDGDTDLVWISQSYPHRFVMWLGDGRGNFSIVTDRAVPYLQALLNRDTQPRLGGDDDSCASVCVLQSTAMATPRSGSTLSPIACAKAISATSGAKLVCSLAQSLKVDLNPCVVTEP